MTRAKKKEEMEKRLSEGEETRGNKINDGGHNPSAAKKNNICIAQVKISIFLPRKFKNLAKCYWLLARHAVQALQQKC